ncbi:formylglycine-generating enzyme family protein [Microbacterium sp. MPKO10]|uniref:formylglycine-generating enzyme family protein n=1 Tax=Microbacterium sp. MPKO10 TaxID=2989818 RepID=UPI0022359AA6|nr:formylglycine-generating enzyme family protein [Microbacterium sp. MPKO10]MCW4457030.1 formylglycine-generating enzyme family protein [Microbacterium sp. MPKO10]
MNPPTMRSIPGGELAMRDARSGASRIATLRPFALAATPVTMWQYVALDETARQGDVDDASAHVPQHPVTWFDAVAWCNRASDSAGLRPAYEIDGRHVRWDVASEGYRLPTEAEWEFACRAGISGPHYGELAQIAWTILDERDSPQPVARKAANDFGLHDMLGNVWEWCWNFADTARYADYRSLRGGGFADPAWSVRASVRRGSAPDAVIDDVGFRVARGAVGSSGSGAAQGWSAEVDRRRADVRGTLPVGWTPHRDLLS